MPQAGVLCPETSDVVRAFQRHFRPAGINGAVHVNLADKSPSLSLTNRPLKVVGKLRVEEMKDGGIVMAIYRLEEAKAEEMTW